jgi:hypothetical protein
MQRALPSIFIIGLTLGCSRAADDQPRVAASAPPAATAAAPAPPPAVITNRFGMTFRLVSVAPRPAAAGDVGKFGIAFPKHDYYLGRTEITSEQYQAFHAAATERDRKTSAAKKNYTFPSEWVFAHNLAVELSAIDPDYDYRLPSREEWAFACMNGYDQDCPGSGNEPRPFTGKRPNKYGIEGFLNYDFECGNLPGLHFGLARAMSKADVPECQCADYAFGDPEGDDGLNDSISARYIITPRAAEVVGTLPVP